MEMPAFALQVLSPLRVGLLGFSVNMLLLSANGFFMWSEKIAALHPTFWSTPSQVLVILWGFAYLAAGLDAQESGAVGGKIW